MGRIIKFIEQLGNGSYKCYNTKKILLDSNDNDSIVYNYDDKTPSTSNRNEFAETNKSRVHTVSLSDMISGKHFSSLFHFFLDGSRHTYKIDDIGIAKKIYPIVAGQIIVGCCERVNRDTFRKEKLLNKIVISMPDDFDEYDGGDNFCRSFCEKINLELAKNTFFKERNINISNLLLYRTYMATDLDKDNYKNRAVAKIQNEMTDEEQRMVAALCKENKLDDSNWLIKDGSLEYSPSFTNMNSVTWNNYRDNYRHVVGVSKMFDPELMTDFEGNRLAKTIASLKPFERTKVYRYKKEYGSGETAYYAIWYLRLRNSNFRDTCFSDIVKCEMVLMKDNDNIDSDLVDTISASLIKEAYPVCYGSDVRWANHLYPVYLTESFCKSNYLNSEIFKNLF